MHISFAFTYFLHSNLPPPNINLLTSMIHLHVLCFGVPICQDEVDNDVTVPSKKKPSANTSKAAKMRAVARGENTAANSKMEQEV